MQSFPFHVAAFERAVAERDCVARLIAEGDKEKDLTKRLAGAKREVERCKITLIRLIESASK